MNSYAVQDRLNLRNCHNTELSIEIMEVIEMWNDVPKPWKVVFEEAWLAFRNGNVPAGAAVYDENNALMSKAHNRYGEPDCLNRYIAHADANALFDLDLRYCHDPSKLTLYSSMEPCHMCLGMINLTGIKNICSASSDLHMGSAHFLYDDAFLRSKQINYRNEGGDAELFTLVLHSYFEIKQITNKKDSSALECYRRTNETAVEIAEKMYFRRILDQWSIQEKTCEEVYNMIMKIKDERYS